MARLYPLFSGSKGNCYYIGSGSGGVLIDAGRSAKQIEQALADNEIPVEQINGIFVTHEHSDHIKGLRVFASRYGINVYGSKGTIKELENQNALTGKFKAAAIDYSGIDLCNMRIIPFKTSHDCAESTGFVVYTSDGRKAAVATDTGILTEKAQKAILGCDAVVIESNHDVNMLLNGIYPYYLKRRILSKVGHLSNDDCSQFLPQLIRHGTTRLVLAHLSAENNMPAVAKQTAVYALQKEDMKLDDDYRLSIAPESYNGQVIIF
ncbi:MAG: MBL fold metallo-hydrolase [Acutalibacteraceae bacterium]